MRGTSMPVPEGRGPRLGAAATAAVVACVLGVPAWGRALADGVPGSLQALLVAAVVFPAVQLVVTTASRQFSIALSCAWVWHLIFMGLVPAYQVPEGRFFWGGTFDESTVTSALILVLACEILLAVTTRPRRRARRVKVPRRARHFSDRRAARVLVVVQLAQLAATLLTVALIGPSGLASGRQAFQEALVGNAAVPGSGTAYFVSTGLALLAPAAGILLRHRRVGSDVMLWLSLSAGALVTNPLLGSRTLTGTFVVAVGGAFLAHRPSRRYVGPVMLLLTVTLFPSLDLWRGNGTGSSSLALMPPETALARGDFDAFEMMLRAVSLHSGVTDFDSNGATLLLAAVLRWVPFVSDAFTGVASGPLVARATGMGFTNVSMPLPAEGLLIAGWAGPFLAYWGLGALLRALREAPPGAGGPVGIIDSTVGGLLFIVLRGSLYSVLGYLILAIGVALLLRAAWPRGSSRPVDSGSGLPPVPRSDKLSVPEGTTS